MKKGRRFLKWLLIVLPVMFSFYFLKEQTVSADEDKVRVAVFDYPCYLTMTEGGRVFGYVYEYLQEIQEYTGWEYEYIPMSFEEAITAVANGTIDIVAGCQKTKERQKKCNFSELSIGQGSVVLCTLPEQNNYSFNDFESYNGMKIAVLKGTLSYEQTRLFFTKRGIKVEFLEYSSDAASKKALDSGRVDAILMTNIRCEKDYKIIARIQAMPWYFMLNKNRQGIKEELDAAMHQIHLEEPYFEAKLDEKYFEGVLRQITMSEQEKNYIRSVGEITVALSVDMNPIEYYDEASKSFRGIVVDTFAVISQITGLSFRYVPKENKSVLDEQMQKGEVQLIGLVAASDQNAESLNVALTEAYSGGSVAIAINTTVTDYKDLDNRVVVVDSSPFFEIMAEELGYTDVIYASTFEECVDIVNRGNADISFLPDYNMEYLMNYPRYANISMIAYPDAIYDYCVGVSDYANTKLLDILNKAITEIPEEVRTEILIKNLTNQSIKESLADFFYRYNTTIFIIITMILIIVLVIITYLNYYRQRTNQQLMEAVKRANTASQAKSDFLSRMSHDLRTPLNAVMGYSDPLVNATATLEEKTSNLSKINLSGRYLLDMINDVLDVVKSENGQLHLHFQPESIDGFFAEIDAVIRPLAEKKGVSFSIQNFDDPRDYVISDQMRVKQIFLNLLNNAVKFTPPGGHIFYEKYKIKEENGRIYNRFVVRDDGIGMKEEFVPHIFEPFVQGDAEAAEGSGLGLAIVKILVEQLGGTITVSSYPGRGTEFLVDLSFELCDKAKAERILLERQKSRDMEGDAGANRHINVREDEADKLLQEASRLAGKRVLLCEDHPINTEIAKRMLERVGIQVELAKNGQQAIDKYTAEPGAFDAVLMDIRMPVTNGLEAARSIREREITLGVKTPIIAMTANAFEDDRRQAAEIGMDGYIAKPINAKRLYELLGEVCRE